MEYENEIESTGWQCFWSKVEAEIYLDFTRKLCFQFAQNYSTRKLKSSKWEIDHTETYFHPSKNPRMEGLVIMNCFV